MIDPKPIEPSESTYEDTFTTAVPTRWVGPLRMSGAAFDGVEEVDVPLATYETPLWPSVGRGGKISRMLASGIATTVHDERMTRSVLFSATDAGAAQNAANIILERFQELADVVTKGSRFAQLIEIHPEIVGNLLFLRFAYLTGDASGHNMATAASDSLMSTILQWNIGLTYGSISGNFCTDKKATAVNGILGRGKKVTAEIVIPHQIVENNLHTTAAKVVQLVVEKNYVGSNLAGAIRSANAHFANMLLAFYLATGQDAANIVEGSQGFVWAENRTEGLYFAVTLPHLIVGTVGNGKHLPYITQAMSRMGIDGQNQPGADSRRLASLIAGSVLAGELSLLAAQTNPGELMEAHVAFERPSSTEN